MSDYLHKIVEKLPVEKFIEDYYPFSEEELFYLARHNYCLDRISGNQKIKWDMRLIKKLEKAICWDNLSFNQSINWAEVAPAYAHRIYWEGACNNPNFVWQHDYFEKYGDQIDWDWICHYKLPFSIDFLFKYRENLAWWRLSYNKYIPWGEEILEYFAHRWDWYSLSSNAAIPFTDELIKKFGDRWIYSCMSMNEQLVSDEKLPWLQSFTEIDYECLSWTKKDFTLAFLEEHEKLFDWNYLTTNEYLPWSLQLIERFKDRWQFAQLAENPKIPWTLNFIEQHEDLWNWGGDKPGIFVGSGGISSNEGIPWTFDFIDRYFKRLSWGRLTPDYEVENCYFVKYGISSNTGINWTVEKMARYANCFCIDLMYKNSNYYRAIENEVGKNNVFNLYLSLV
jgi:hypothetical protein